MLTNKIKRNRIKENNMQTVREALQNSRGAQAATAKKAADYIEAHFTEKFSLERMAAALFINKIYLAKCFKRVTDYTLLQYHNLVRCEKAAELLRTTDLSIEIISGQVGYATASHFSRTFRTVYHCSPMEYRKGENGRIN